jgi:uncharacterized iron-regulated membrane protein
MPHAVTGAEGGTACPVCAEEDCVLHRGVLMVAQLVNAIVGLALLMGSMALAWTWLSRGSTF